MKKLSIDIETFSSVDLTKSGVYKYAEADDFEILLFSYAIDDGEVKLVDFTAGETLPRAVFDALFDTSIEKWAFNAQFERICISRYFLRTIEPNSWRCSMVWSATLGLPMSLRGVGAVLGLDKQKMEEGKELIRYFCTPCKPTKANGNRTRNLPEHAPEKWELFKAYNIRDVEVEISIQQRLSKFPVSQAEWQNYALDQVINDRGILLDLQLVKSAIDCDTRFKSTHLAEAQNLTGLENPNSVQQLTSWLQENGVVTESLNKASVKELIENSDGDIQRMLELRQQLSKSSVKKYEAMECCACGDNRAHGLIQFYGTRTGRYAGRLVQVQNLPQNHLPELAQARESLKQGHYAELEKFGATPNVLSELIRTAFIPKDGCLFYVADFAAIEARVIAWFAGEHWRTEVFKNGGDIYCASASQMFKVPVEKHGVNSHLRAKGKIAELALGYGGSVGALSAMGAIQMGVKENELLPLVTAWREANPNITRFWWDVDKAVKKAIREKTTVGFGSLTFSYQSGILFIKLPSGRNIAYVKPKIEENSYGQMSVTYEGVGTSKKWMRIESYGPKFVENIVQATARDILAEAMVRLEKQGYPIVMHVHDEVVVEAPKGESLDTICELMAEVPSWGEGLILRADGFVTEFYKKDD